MPEGQISAKKAIAIAVDHVSDLYEEIKEKVDFEEIEKYAGDWLITVSIPRYDISFAFSGVTKPRKYVVVRVNPSGDVISIKMR